MSLDVTVCGEPTSSGHPCQRRIDPLVRYVCAQHEDAYHRRMTACVDCGTPTMPATPPGSRDWQRYMVHDEVWADAGMDPDGGWLCIACLESRLGRRLQPADLADVPLNHPLWRFSTDDTDRLMFLKLKAALRNGTQLWQSELDVHTKRLAAMAEVQ